MKTNVPITARTFPLGDDGKFQSEPAEAAWKELERFILGSYIINRTAFRKVLQRYAEAEDRCRAEYEEFRRKREEEMKHGT